MSATRLAGLFIAAIGILAGAALVAHPLMPEMQISVITMALLFPGCLLLGVMLGASGQGRAGFLQICGGALLILGLGALSVLFAHAAGLLQTQPGLTLWIIAPVSVIAGLALNAFARALGRLDQS